MSKDRNKNPNAVALGKLAREKLPDEHYRAIGKKGMAVRWKGHKKKAKKVRDKA